MSTYQNNSNNNQIKNPKKLICPEDIKPYY